MGDEPGCAPRNARLVTSGILLTAPSSAADVQELVRGALARSAPLRIRGAGTWMDAGAPVQSAETLALGRLSGIVDYVPGDLTLTARAATPLSEIASVTGAEGQWLALDPVGSPHGTLGATIATGSSGALAAGFGPVRDAVLGLEVVTGAGTVVRGGGRVVKNVAGFDLCRLFTGAWGTLGVITEATVRLRALPVEERTVAIELRDEVLDELLARLRQLPFTPLAAQLIAPSLSSHLDLGGRAALLLRLGGNPQSLDAQVRAISALGEVFATSPEVWQALRTTEPAGSAVLRLSRAPARLSGLWRAAAAIAAAVPGASAHACAIRGIVRLIIPPADEATTSQALRAASAGDQVVVPERLPAEWWPRLRVAAARSDLSRKVRAAFDPRPLLNRGILGEVS